eukprot:TRINITY_DN7374_c0_g1_i1.p1 TRINITY_DN7374_c0_g1~~TRINITY_DN7374_c0_g1_i1.p1  ORF type:complete len:579 (+),score=86.04 TRINITY_DN7374_c0_g1_i1:76-1812(+)
MELILVELGGIHLHCATCISFARCSQEDDACDNIPCRLSCSQVFHACKEFEHMEYLCPNARVPCLNAGYGCELQIPRRELASHLTVCPASLIVCTAEWHRWPLYSSTRSLKGELLNINPLPKKGQLDYELAMRDQSIISKATKIPRPPLPSLSKLSKYISRKEPSGDSMESDPHMIKQLERWGEELKRRVKGIPPPRKYWEFPEREKGNIHPRHCSTCVLKDCSGDPDNFCPIITCSWGCKSSFHACKSSEHSLICEHYLEPNDSDWIYRGMSRVVDRKSLRSCRNSASLKGLLKPHQRSSFTGVNDDIKDVERRPLNGSIIPKPPPPPPVPEFWSPCQFDIRYDFVNNKRDRQRGVLHGIRCHEELRRDQYSWHYRNIHCEIITELGSWVESRCPLYGLGCNFAARRLFPGHKDKTIGFNRFSGTFVLENKSSPSIILDTDKDYGLHLLPIEILSIILSYVDPSSLQNLSLTCKYLREVCQSFLDVHGCVAPQWECQRTEGKTSWSISSFRWFYSSSIDPIRSWRIENLGAVSNHLQECPFNRKVQRQNPDSSSKEKWIPVFKELRTKIRCTDVITA